MQEPNVATQHASHIRKRHFKGTRTTTPYSRRGLSQIGLFRPVIVRNITTNHGRNVYPKYDKNTKKVREHATVETQQCVSQPVQLVAGRGRSFRIETEIDKRREETNWKKVVDLLQQLLLWSESGQTCLADTHTAKPADTDSRGHGELRYDVQLTTSQQNRIKQQNTYTQRHTFIDQPYSRNPAGFLRPPTKRR